MRKKYILTLIVTLIVVLFITIDYTKYNAKTVILTIGSENAIIDGRTVLVDSENNVVPIVEDGRTLVPARFIAETFGAKVDFADSTVIINYNNAISKIKLGEKTINIGENIINLDVPAKTINNRTMLPLRIICEEVLNKIVNYDNGVITISDKAEYRRINSEQAKEIIEKEEVIILDVRTQSEFEEGHIKNAILIPYDEISSKAESILKNKDAKILVYCRSGRRSEIASRELINMGYTDVIDFGGIIDWKYEIVK